MPSGQGLSSQQSSLAWRVNKGHFFSYQTKIKKNRNLLILKKQLSSHSFGLQMDGKTINKRQEALSRLPNSWLLRLSQHARDEKSSSKHTRKAKKRARLASFSCLSNLWRKKKPLKIAFDKIDSYFSVFNLCCSTYNYSSWEFNNDILRGTSFSQPYSDFLMILHIG